MAVNRIIYALCLAGSVLYFYLAQSWLSWILLLFISVLPLLSFLLSLIFTRKCSLDIRTPEYSEMDAEASAILSLNTSKFMFLPLAGVWISVKTPYGKKNYKPVFISEKKSISFPLPTDKPGYAAAYVRKSSLFDFLGILSLSLKSEKVPPMAVLPPEKEPESMPDTDRYQSQQYKPKAGGFSEVYENREYRPGDPVKSIHWKLSLKSDSLIIKEPQTPLGRRMVLALETPSNEIERVKNIGELRYISRRLLEEGDPHEICYIDGEDFKTLHVTNMDEHIKAITAVCLAPETSSGMPVPVPARADWIYTIGKTEVMQ